MGLSPFKSCYTNLEVPNPSPYAWELLDYRQYNNAYVLKVLYTGCTNFEGVKIMVFKGTYSHKACLDPHFSEEVYSPLARFIPTEEGWVLANTIASTL